MKRLSPRVLISLGVCVSLLLNSVFGQITTSPSSGGVNGDGTFAGLDFTASNLASVQTRNFSDLQSKPTTFSGYGISDTSANLAAALTNEVGYSTGAKIVFNQGPTIYDNAATPQKTLDFNARVAFGTSGDPAFRWDAITSGGNTGTNKGLFYVPGPTGTSAGIAFDPDGEGIEMFDESGARVFNAYNDTGAITIGGNSVATNTSINLRTYAGYHGSGADFWQGSILIDLLFASQTWHLPNATGNFALTTNTNGVVDATHGGTGLTSLGTGVATALGVNVGSAGAFVTYGGAGSFTTVAQTGKTTTYNNIATVGNGVPSEVATIDSTGLTANVAASTLYAVPASGAGLYRVSAYLVTTTAASVSSTMPNAQVVYTDSDSNTSVTLDVSPILGAAGLGQSGLLTANTVGTVFSGTVVVYIKSSTTIQYQTVNYASTAGGMTYALRMKLEAL